VSKDDINDLSNGESERKEEGMSENFGLIIQKYRKEKGLSLSSLESMSNVSASFINRIERNERNGIAFDKTIRIADCLGIPYSLLISCAFSKAKLEGCENEVLSLSDIFIQNEFKISEEVVSIESKVTLIDIINHIFECSWDNKTKIFDLCLIGEKIEKLRGTYSSYSKR